MVRNDSARKFSYPLQNVVHFQLKHEKVPRFGGGIDQTAR